MRAELRKIVFWAVAGGFLVGLHTTLLFQGKNAIWIYFNMLLGIAVVYVSVLSARGPQTEKLKEDSERA